MPRVSKLFSDAYQTSPGKVSFWYWHPGRTEATIDVDIRRGTVCYTSQAGNSSGMLPGSDVTERNIFPNYVKGGPIHAIRFIDMHSKWGDAQGIVFEQVGLRTWKGKHRTGVTCLLILKSPIDPDEGRLFAPELPDVIVL